MHLVFDACKSRQSSRPAFVEQNEPAYKYCVKMLEKGMLEEEIDCLVIDKNYQTVLRNLGVLVEDNTPAQRIKQLL